MGTLWQSLNDKMALFGISFNSMKKKLIFTKWDTKMEIREKCSLKSRRKILKRRNEAFNWATYKRQKAEIFATFWRDTEQRQKILLIFFSVRATSQKNGTKRRAKVNIKWAFSTKWWTKVKKTKKNKNKNRKKFSFIYF